MELALRMTKNKYLKTIICIVLCLTTLCLTLYLDYQEAHAALPAIIIGGVLIPKAVVIITGLLAAAGVTYLTAEAAEAASNWYVNTVKPAIREKIIYMCASAIDKYGDNAGVAYVEPEVWTSAKTWVDGLYNYGENPYVENRTYLAEVQVVYEATPVKTQLLLNYDIEGTTICPVFMELGTEYQVGNDYYRVEVEPYIGTNKNFKLYINDAYTIGDSRTYNTVIPCGFYFNAYRGEYGPELEIRGRGAGYNDTEWNEIDAYIKTIHNAEILTPIPDTYVRVPGIGQAVVDTEHDMLSEDGETRAFNYATTADEMLNKTKDDVVVYDLPSNVKPYSNSWEGTFRDCVATGEYVFDGTGDAEIGYAAEGVWQGIWDRDLITGERIWHGSFVGVDGKVWQGTITEVIDDNRTWWSTVIGGIKTGIEDLGQLLVGNLAQLKAAVEALAAPIVQEIEDAGIVISGKLTEAKTAIDGVFVRVGEMAQSIASVKENTTEKDMTQKLRSYKIPDLFILILKVILACIRLILRALVFIATLPAIPANAGNINGDFLSGVEFLKNQTIPYFGVSLWSMVTGVIAIFFGLAVVKRIRRLYSV